MSLCLYFFRKKIKFIFSALILLLFFSNGIVSYYLIRLVEYPWQRLETNSIDQADGIVVLSGGRHLPPGNTKIYEWHDPDRFLAGINLYKKGKSKRLIFTGGINPLSSNLPPEGDIYKKEAIEMNLPEENIFTTYSVHNTYQEAKAVKKLLQNVLPLKKRKIILVTSAFHMIRAKRLFEREGMIIEPYPVDFISKKSSTSYFFNPLTYIPSSENLNKSSLAIREIIGRFFYRTWF